MSDTLVSKATKAIDNTTAEKVEARLRYLVKTKQISEETKEYVMRYKRLGSTFLPDDNLAKLIIYFMK